jgi:hypothetical protein
MNHFVKVFKYQQIIYYQYENIKNLYRIYLHVVVLRLWLYNNNNGVEFTQ